ncbi:ABC transporter permease [Escherichia coli]|uniref:ABC transporter permease n=1 Tax=Escherichia coli TaxID=562 RepID=A0A376U5X6_ECOLX|nr:ABC transporter permease [Escherichia coli]
MPTLFLIILLSSVVQPNFWWLLAITVLFGWMSLVGVVRAEFLRTRNFDYIRAAQALGVSDRSIILRHMLPNAMVATLTFLPFILCSSITTLTSLDFLASVYRSVHRHSVNCCYKGKITFRPRGLGSPPSCRWRYYCLC